MPPFPLIRLNFSFLYLLLIGGSWLTLFAKIPRASLTVQADSVIETTDRHRLIGTNATLWMTPEYLADIRLKEALAAWKPALIRMPGGSWSDQYYWNGNGVRIGNDHAPKNFDASKQNPDGSWRIDYSAYKPGFQVQGQNQGLADYHGGIDVKTQHEWIQNQDAETLVTVNLGSGSPQLAAEWVRWANLKNNYNVRYWELGNELSGDWELGHRLPDGSSMTAEIYAQRYLKFANAMRAIDPSIKLGGPASPDTELDFTETLIRDAGDAIDYVSFHAYPVGVSVRKPDQKFADIETVRKAIKKIRTWIQKYQPERDDVIEIGLTEWNIKVNEDRDTADLINGLWSAVFIGTLFEAGVDFANQWDLVTQVKEGGHSTFYHDEATLLPKSQYWALWMWGQLMGNELLASKVTGSDSVYSYVTRSEEGLQIMCINASVTESCQIKLNIQSTRALNPETHLHQFTSAQYFWNPHANRPLWSLPPSTQALDLKQQRTLTLPPFSINVLRIPYQPNAFPEIASKDALIAPSLKFILPERAPIDRPIEAWVVALDSEKQRPDLSAQTHQPVTLRVEGPAQLNTQNLTLNNGSASFIINPNDAGTLNLSAQLGALQTTQPLELIRLGERSLVQWTFDNPIEEWNIESSFDLDADPSIRPNQVVAVARLKKQSPQNHHDLLFHFEPLPYKDLSFKLENISGIIGKLQANRNLKCADPRARIDIVLQSEANHWMPIGSIPLSELKGEWNDFEFRIQNPQHLEAVKKLYAIRIKIRAKQPVTGEFYLDDLGFILKTEL